jgi:hypothetical protein
MDPARVNTVELWESWSHVHAWRAVAIAPDTAIPVIEDHVQAYEIAAVNRPSSDAADPLRNRARLCSVSSTVPLAIHSTGGGRPAGDA